MDEIGQVASITAFLGHHAEPLRPPQVQRNIVCPSHATSASGDCCPDDEYIRYVYARYQCMGSTRTGALHLQLRT